MTDPPSFIEEQKEHPEEANEGLIFKQTIVEVKTDTPKHKSL